MHEFYTNLCWTVQTLAIMKNLERAQSRVYSIMDNLGPVNESMAQRNDDWEEWGLAELVGNLRKYTDRNPLLNEIGGKIPKSPKGSQVSDRRRYNLLLAVSCSVSDSVYWGSNQHRSRDCNKILDIASHREFLEKHKLCYNCTRSSHLPVMC